MRIRTANNNRKRVYRRSLGFTIGKHRWKGETRKIMEREMKRLKRGGDTARNQLTLYMLGMKEAN